MRAYGKSAVHDFPASVGLPAGGAVGPLRLAADNDLLLVFAAVGPVGCLVRMRRRDAAGIAAVRVLPRRGLSGGRPLQSILRRLVCITSIVLVKRIANRAAQETAHQGTSHDTRATPAQGRPEKTASRGTAETADCGLGAEL